MIVRGRNIYPYDIERTIADSHATFQKGGCAVFALAKEEAGEEVVAVQEVARAARHSLAYDELAGVVRRADLVIANNSGVAHLAAACGRPTLAIYSGSHQPQEWGPRGENVRTVTAAVPCSPCGYERLELCPHDHRCMTLIEPETIFRDAVAMLSTRPAQTEAA